MNKRKLLQLIGKKNERKAAIVTEADACEDVAQLRAYNEEISTLDEEIRGLQEIADSMPDEDGDEGPAARTSAVNGEVPGVVTPAIITQSRAAENEDMEYRTAFMNYVTRGIAIPTELRADENTLTSDVSTAIPTIVVNRIIEKIESTGMILPLFNRTSYASGIQIPTSSVKPVATWTTEGGTSDRQKKTTGYITFSSFKLRCEISMSMEVGVMAIAAFEKAFAKQVAEAMVKAIESAAISTADGTTSPKGILAETPNSGQLLEAATQTYAGLVAAEAALPQAYEDGAKWCMTKKTFMGYIGMEDANGQPVARITYGLGGKPERSLLGRDVVLCGDYMSSFSAALEVGTIFAFIFKFDDYTLNTLYNMGVKRKEDWDTEDQLIKAVMSVDGKVTDKNSLVVIKKK